MKIIVVITLTVVVLCSCGSDEPDTILVAPTNTPTKLPRLNCYEIAQRVKRSGGGTKRILDAQADCIQENARRGY